MRRVRGGQAPGLRRLTDRLLLRAPTQPPDEAGHRHATWLELFFDVVFVFALAEVVERFGTDPTPGPSAVLAVCGLFVVVQWAWVGQVYYDTRYDPDDLPHRLLVLVALLGAGAMTLGIDEAPESALLPVGYLTVRGVLLLLYLRVRPSGPAARQVTDVYLAGFGTGWLIWLASLAAPAPARPAFWVVGMAVELATPWVGMRRLSRNPVDVRHLPERIGQFTIIVLGSALADLLGAVPDRPNPAMVLAAAVAFVVPASMWWVYTTFVSTGLALTRMRGGQAYTYLHFPLGGSLLVLGWSLGEVVRHLAVGSPTVPAGLRLMLAASLLVWMLCGLGMNWMAVRRPGARRLAMSGYGVGSVSLVAATVARPLPLLGALAVAMVIYAVLIVRRLDQLRTRRAPVGPPTGT